MKSPQKENDPHLEDILPLHQEGKTRMVSRYSLDSVASLRKIYTPGVAKVCQLIEENPEKACDFTSIGNTVAVITNGSAVLGLGDIGVRASMPVMEGKAVILMEMAGVSAIPVLVDTSDPDEFIRTVSLIAPTFGAILLEDISAPLCFQVEDSLKARLPIPVFHDDQHGTAVVVLGALLRALEACGRQAGELDAVINGAGAAGWAIARFLLNFGINDVVLCDSRGAIYRGRENGMNPVKQDIAECTNRANEQGELKSVIRGKDLFIGVSAGGVVSPAMVASMAPGPIVFAMANPVPEIWPHEAIGAGAAVATDGRNLNNALGFPGIFRGALNARANAINEEMKVGAARALAEQAHEGELVPDFMDKKVHLKVAEAVAEAARRSGVAEQQPGR